MFIDKKIITLWHLNSLKLLNEISRIIFPYLIDSFNQNLLDKTNRKGKKSKCIKSHSNR